MLIIMWLYNNKQEYKMYIFRVLSKTFILFDVKKYFSVDTVDTGKVQNMFINI